MIAISSKDILRDLCFKLSNLGIQHPPREKLMKEIGIDKKVVTFRGARIASEHGQPQKLVFDVCAKLPDETAFYKPHTVRAWLIDAQDKSCLFDVEHWPLFKIRHIQNLLNGRPVLRQRFHPEANYMDNFWYKVNFNNRDELGNFRLNEYWPKSPNTSDYLHLFGSNVKYSKLPESPYAQPVGLSLKSLCDLLTEYPLKETRTYNGTLRLLSAIMDGAAPEVTPISKNAEHIGYLQLKDDLQSMELLLRRNGKLIRVDTDLREIAQQPTQHRQRGKSR